MIAFWLIGAALAAVALFLVLRPLLARPADEGVSRDKANAAIYKDQLRELEGDLAAATLAQADYERSRKEIEARLLEDFSGAAPAPVRPRARASAIALGITVPLLAVAVYLAIGNPGAIHAPQAGVEAAQIEAMVARLAAKLRENPDDADGWKLLGRSYAALGRFGEAVDAYAKAAQRSPRDAQLLTDFADALAMVRGQRLEGEPAKLIERALEIDPNNLKALALAGTVAFERKDYAQAVALWQRLLPRVPPDSEDARIISENVEEARKLAQIGSHPGVRGIVRLSPELKKQVKPDDVVFVFARAAQGPPMPLAVLRAKAADLPIQFNLNDSMAMAQGLKVSGFPRVIVAARVSKSGNATPQPGDLQGASTPVANDATGVSVLIDSVVR